LNANLTAGDFTALFFPSLTTAATTVTYPVTTTGGVLGVVPTNYLLILNMEPNAQAQTYEFEVLSQDGVRYPANTMAAAVAMPTTTAPLTEAHVQRLSNHAADTHVGPEDSASQVGSVSTQRTRQPTGKPYGSSVASQSRIDKTLRDANRMRQTIAALSRGLGGAKY